MAWGEVGSVRVATMDVPLPNQTSAIARSTVLAILVSWVSRLVTCQDGTWATAAAFAMYGSRLWTSRTCNAAAQ